MKPTLILFSGLPGTGKTTLSVEIAKLLHIPLTSKDVIKEIMYDTIGWSDKEFSAKQARATFAIMGYILEEQLKNGRSLILEANYWPKFADSQFQQWQETYKCTIVQIVCQTEPAILAQRLVARLEQDRHPGHLEIMTKEQYEASIVQRLQNGEDQPLAVDGPIRIVDTTDFRNVNANELANWIQQQIDYP